MSRQSRTTSAAVGLVVFLLVAAGMIAVIAATIRPLAAPGARTYQAVFTNASRLAAGDEVRVAGVRVGRVTSVEVAGSTQAKVTFTVERDLGLTRGTQAAIRYLNLVGERYLALIEGKGQPLDAGATIPLSQTQPALDLNALFNGFKPLFTALSPKDANQLATSIVATLQGEGETLTSLLQHTAELTTSLANRDQVIGRLVSNLDRVLSTVDHRQAGLSELVLQLDRFLTGLDHDKEAITTSLRHIDSMAQVTVDLLQEARPGLRTDIAQLGRVAQTLDDPLNRTLLERILRTTPRNLDRMSRAGSYGSWFNFYLCDMTISLRPDDHFLQSLLKPVFDQVRRIQLHDTTQRCRP